MTRAKFTEPTIRGIRAQRSRFEKFEDNGRGFGVRVAPTGRKTWITLYRFDGKPRRLTHGTFPAIGLAEARRRHAEALEQVDKGVDPAGQKVQKRAIEKAAVTFSQLVDEYERVGIAKRVTGKEMVRLLRKDAVPAFGRRKANSITRRDVRELLRQVEGRSASVAEHLKGRLVKLFNFGVEEGLLEQSPIIGLEWDRMPSRERVLTNEEIQTFWNASSDATKLNMTQTVADAARMILATGQRPGEVVGMEWDEVEGDLWTIPVTRQKTRAKVKNPRPHTVPLTKTAQAILNSRRHLPRPFPSPRVNGESPIIVSAISRAFRNNAEALGIGDATPHDLRRTVSTRIHGLGVSDIVAERVLNHALQGMLRVYNRHDYTEEKREALTKWERELKRITKGVKREAA